MSVLAKNNNNLGYFFLVAGNFMIGERFPAWALALSGGLVLALIVAMTTRSDKQPWGHSVSTTKQQLK